jgi:hypothetical protein
MFQEYNWYNLTLAKKQITSVLFQTVKKTNNINVWWHTFYISVLKNGPLAILNEIFTLQMILMFIENMTLWMMTYNKKLVPSRNFPSRRQWRLLQTGWNACNDDEDNTQFTLSHIFTFFSNDKIATQEKLRYNIISVSSALAYTSPWNWCIQIILTRRRLRHFSMKTEHTYTVHVPLLRGNQSKKGTSSPLSHQKIMYNRFNFNFSKPLHLWKLFFHYYMIFLQSKENAPCRPSCLF